MAKTIVHSDLLGPLEVSRPLLVGEIEGVRTHYHRLAEGVRLDLAASRSELTILFLLSGSATLASADYTARFDQKVAFVQEPGIAASVTTHGPTELLELDWALHDDESLGDTRYPLVQVYKDCPQYRDYFKSDKTISRTIVGPHVLPRFCMGSVESYGPDRIEPHAHPMLDQLFFSLPENDIDLLIDDERHKLGGNTLLHIPLGSNHGVDVAEGKAMHYIWIDFFQNRSDMDYIASVHKDVPNREF